MRQSDALENSDDGLSGILPLGLSGILPLMSPRLCKSSSAIGISVCKGSCQDSNPRGYLHKFLPYNGMLENTGLRGVGGVVEQLITPNVIITYMFEKTSLLPFNIKPAVCPGQCLEQEMTKSVNDVFCARFEP